MFLCPIHCFCKVPSKDKSTPKYVRVSLENGVNCVKEHMDSPFSAFLDYSDSEPRTFLVHEYFHGRLRLWPYVLACLLGINPTKIRPNFCFCFNIFRISEVEPITFWGIDWKISFLISANVWDPPCISRSSRWFLCHAYFHWTRIMHWVQTLHRRANYWQAWEKIGKKWKYLYVYAFTQLRLNIQLRRLKNLEREKKNTCK